MKLYYKPGACSLASHIALYHAGANFEIVEVDTDKGVTKSGSNFLNINPKGYVPALELDSGEILTEGASILQYIADRHPDSDLAPVCGSVSRARLHEHLNYVSSELHKAFSPLFSDTSTDEEKSKARKNVSDKFNYLNDLLSDGRIFLLGDTFTVADAYMFVVSNWSSFVGIELSNWPKVALFVDRVSQLPAAQHAMRKEGLIN